MKRFLYFLMSLLGFAAVSCDNAACDYGCPYAKFKVKGVVTDEENRPIENIQVVVDNSDTVYTDIEGMYSTLPRTISPWDTVRVVATDIDGKEGGGEFESASQKVGFSQKEFVGGDDDWYMGQVAKEVNFKLKQKNND